MTPPTRPGVERASFVPGQGRHRLEQSRHAEWPSRCPTPSRPPTPHFMFLAGGAAGRQGRPDAFPAAAVNAVMSHALLGHMKKHGVKSVGFLGYTDAYGDWLKDFQAGPRRSRRIRWWPPALRPLRHQRDRAGAQAGGRRPDAMLIVASGSGAAMPHKAVVERGDKGAGSTRPTPRPPRPDARRRQGCRGRLVVSGPAVIGEQLPTATRRRRSRSTSCRSTKAHGAGSRNQFAGHA